MKITEKHYKDIKTNNDINKTLLLSLTCTEITKSALYKTTFITPTPQDELPADADVSPPAATVVGVADGFDVLGRRRRRRQAVPAVADVAIRRQVEGAADDGVHLRRRAGTSAIKLSLLWPRVCAGTEAFGWLDIRRAQLRS